MSAPRPTRRQVATGLAWSVPAVTAAAAVPAMAASRTPPAIQRSFLLTLGPTVAGPAIGVAACASGSTRMSVTTDNTTYYYRITNVRTGSTVTNPTASVLVEKAAVDALSVPLTWTSATKDWSNPTREVDAKGTPVVYTDNGIQYYRYASQLLTPVPAPVNGTITLPRIQWYTACSTPLYNRVRAAGGIMANGRGSVTVNGVALANVGAYRKLTLG